MDNVVLEMLKELAETSAEAYKKEAKAFFDDYKNYTDASDIAYIFSKAFHDMFWSLENDIEKERKY